MRKIDLPKIVEKGLSLGVKSIFFFDGLPILGSKGGIVKVEDIGLNNQDIRSLFESTTTSWQQRRFEELKELDYTVQLQHYGFIRINAFIQRGSVGLVARPIPKQVPPFGLLGLPEQVRALSRQRDGLVFITGPAGSGKSTTMASLADSINQDRNCHIVTIEDPVEYVHTPRRAIVSQREIGKDTRSYDEALKRVLRQDPDVIFINEVRDRDLMKMVVSLADAGRLVFSTLHTDSVVQTLDRIFDFLSDGVADQVRGQISRVLRGIVCQRLIPRVDGRGFACAVELMVVNSSIRNLIREGKAHQIPPVMEYSSGEGMITMDQSLLRLNKMGFIAVPEAVRHSSGGRGFMEKVVESRMEVESSATGKTVLPLERDAILYKSDFAGKGLSCFDGSGILLETPRGLLFRASGARGKGFHYIADYSILNGARSSFCLRSIFHLSYKIIQSGSGARGYPFRLRIVSQEKEEMEMPKKSVNLVADSDWHGLTIPVPKIYRGRTVKHYMLLFDADIREIVFDDISFL